MKALCSIKVLMVPLMLLGLLGGCAGGSGSGSGDGVGGGEGGAVVGARVSWPANPDDPAGYNVYIGPTADTADKLAFTLVKGSPGMDASAPAVNITEKIVNTIVGPSSQVCVRIKAYNRAGLSQPSEATCISLK